MNLFFNLFLPKIAYASVDTVVANVDNLIVNPLIKFMFALAIVYFLYGMFDFLLHQEDETKKTEGKMHMLWGIVGITIMLGVWGIMSLVLKSIGVSSQIQINDQQNGKVNIQLNNYTPPSIKIGS